MKKNCLEWLFSWPVWIAALGYFVDIYDLTLFSIVRIPSLQEIGVPSDKMLSGGIWILNMQMLGMLIGGLAWGILADKKGRKSVLWASILLYSTANFLNAFVWDETTYGIIRFVAGFGLAGELGVGITLVTESLPTKVRGLGTLIVASVGVSGAIFGFFIAEWFNWRAAYLLGGILGFALLFLRMHLFDSALFKSMLAEEQNRPRGRLLWLFTPLSRFKRYLSCILIGIPLWAVVGILITFSPEIAKALNVEDTIIAGRCMMLCYTGLVIGDVLSCSISQLLKSRKKALFLFLTMNSILLLGYFSPLIKQPSYFYLLMFLFGLSCGYWALFVTVAAESFGTNLRATVATSVPNMVRGSVILLTLSFQKLDSYMAIEFAAMTIVFISVLVSMIALFFLPETFHQKLDFYEK